MTDDGGTNARPTTPASYQEMAQLVREMKDYDRRRAIDLMPFRQRCEIYALLEEAARALEAWGREMDARVGVIEALKARALEEMGRK